MGLFNPTAIPAFLPNEQRVLASLRGANFNVTTDQAFVIPAGITKFLITGINVTNASLSLTLAAGGVYTVAAKGGTVLVLAAQLYSALSASTILLPLTLVAVANTTALTAAPFFSLTTAQGAAATADIYLVGIDLT